MRCGARYWASGRCSNASQGCEGNVNEWVPLPFGGGVPPLSASDAEEVIKSGSEAGKTVGQLQAEIFDPNVSDLEYFEQRRKALGL